MFSRHILFQGRITGWKGIVQQVFSIVEKILLIPAFAAVVGIAIVGVVHVYKFVKYELSRD